MPHFFISQNLYASCKMQGFGSLPESAPGGRGVRLGRTTRNPRPEPSR